MQAEGNTIKEILTDISRKNPDLTVKDLKRKIIFLNGVDITELKIFRTKVEKGDEITIMSPVSGG